MRVHVIGVGTPHADDAAGLAVADVLASRALPAGIVVKKCAVPLPGLLDELDGADAAVLVDAALGVAAPGTLCRLAPHEIARAGAASSHGFGVGDALALAAALGRAPQRIEVLAIGAEHGAGDGLSPRVAAAIAPAADAALALACALQRGEVRDA